MPELPEGKKATEARDRCVKRLEGKTNPRTNEPYTESERYAICTAAVKKAKHTAESAWDTILESIDDQRLFDFAQSEISNDNKKTDNKDAGHINTSELDEDGTELVKGQTEEDRDAKNILHFHKYELTAFLDEAQQLIFKGFTTSTSEGQDHKHTIYEVASDSTKLAYTIETKEGSDGSGEHFLSFQLVDRQKKQEPEEEEEASVAEKEPKEKVAEKKKVAAAAVHTGRKSVDTDEQGIVLFSDGTDGRRHYKSSTLAFCSPMFSKSPGKSGGLHIKLEDDGRLRQMVFREGVFVHPFFGVINANPKMINALKMSFDMNVLGQRLPMSIHHQNALGALGFHDELQTEKTVFVATRGDGKKIEKEGMGLMSFTELTPFGKRELVDDKKYIYASAEFYLNLKDTERFTIEEAKLDHDRCEEKDDEDKKEEDPHMDEDEEGGKHMKYKNVFVGSAATNIPFIPRMKAFTASSEDVTEVYDSIIKKYGSKADAAKHVFSEMGRRGIY